MPLLEEAAAVASAGATVLVAPGCGCEEAWWPGPVAEKAPGEKAGADLPVASARSASQGGPSAAWLGLFREGGALVVRAVSVGTERWKGERPAWCAAPMAPGSPVLLLQGVALPEGPAPGRWLVAPDGAPAIGGPSVAGPFAYPEAWAAPAGTAAPPGPPAPAGPAQPTLDAPAGPAPTPPPPAPAPPVPADARLDLAGIDGWIVGAPAVPHAVGWPRPAFTGGSLTYTSAAGTRVLVAPDERLHDTIVHVRWAGDLDRDGRLDVLLGYAGDAADLHTVLLLSGGGAPLKLVAGAWDWDCC